MSDAKTKLPAVRHGTLYKVTEVGLGVISAGSLALNFIPGLNLVGAAAQGGVTVVQTGMDLASGDRKKAAISFASGTAFTALSLIPELGIAAKGGALAAKVIGGGAKGVEAAGAFGEAANAAAGAARVAEIGGETAKAGVFTRSLDVVKKPFVATWNGTKAIAGRTAELPGVRTVVQGAKSGKNFVMTGSLKGVAEGGEVTGGLTGAENYLRTGAASGKGAGGFEALKENNHLMRGASKLYNEHTIGRKVVQTGLFAGATGVSMMNDSPPGNLLNSDTYSPRDDNATAPAANNAWQKRIAQEREQQAAISADTSPAHS